MPDIIQQATATKVPPGFTQYARYDHYNPVAFPRDSVVIRIGGDYYIHPGNREAYNSLLGPQNEYNALLVDPRTGSEDYHQAMGRYEAIARGQPDIPVTSHEVNEAATKWHDANPNRPDRENPYYDPHSGINYTWLTPKPVASLSMTHPEQARAIQEAAAKSASRGTSDSDKLNDMLKSGASVYQAMTFWYEKGHTIEDIDPGSAVGQKLDKFSLDELGGAVEEAATDIASRAEKKKEAEIKKAPEYQYKAPPSFEEPVNKAEFEKQLKSAFPALYTIYKEKGLDAYNKEVDRLNTQVEEQQKALTLLKHYEDKDGKYNLVTFFQDMKEHIPDNRGITKAQQTLEKAGFSKEDISKARIYAFEAGTNIGPSKYPARERVNIFERARTGFDLAQLNFNNWNEKLRNDIIKGSEDYSSTAKQLNQGAGGIMTTIIGIVPSMVFLGGEAILHPTRAPTLAKGIGQGIVQSVKNLAPGTRANSYDIAASTVNLGLIAASGYAMGKGALTKITVYVAPRGVPAGVIAKEISTGRIPTKAIPTDAIADAMLEVQKKAMIKGGEFTGEVPIKGTAFNLRYLKTPIQQEAGNILFHGAKDGLKFVEESKGELSAKEAGIYTDPWAAVGYARGGTDPGLVMIVTDTSKLKSVPHSVTKDISQSGKFIQEAKEGFYGPSKIWRGDFETEIVGAPGTKIIVPPPKTDIATRVLAGKYADFFTYDNGRFVPIKLGVDKSLIINGKLPALPGPADLYAAKLLTLKNSLRDTGEALKHPGLVLKDIIEPMKSGLKHPEEILGRSIGEKKGRISFPGVRDVYLVKNLGGQLKETARVLWNKAFKKTTKEAKAKDFKLDSAKFREAFERNLERDYARQAGEMLSRDAALAAAYKRSPEAREKFESIYLANLSSSIEAMSKTSIIGSSSLRSVSSELRQSSRVSRDGISKSSRPSKSLLSSRVVTEEPPKIERPPREPPRTGEPPRRPPRTGEPPRIKTRGDGSLEALTTKERKGAVAWKQGIGWWVVLADGRNFFSRTKPEGVRIVERSNKPGKTIQTVGGRPISLTADLGKVDIKIISPGANPGKAGAIKFSPDTRMVTRQQVRLGKQKSSGLKSKREGILYHTKVTDGVLLSRRRLN